MRLDEIGTYLGAAERDLTVAKARVELLRAQAIEAARAAHADTGADRWPVPDLGTITWEGHSAPPVLSIIKPAELAEHLAEHHPDAVRVTVTIPPDKVRIALAALREWAQLDVVAEHQLEPHAAEAWLAEHATARTDPDTGAWAVVQVTEEGRVSVPGVTAVKRSPRLVFRAAPGLRAAWMSEATVDVEGLLTGPAAPPAVTDDLESLPKASLEQMCRDAGLPASGTKAELATRIRGRVAAGAP